MNTFTYIDTPRLVPVDVVAEESLAGKAIVSGEDALHITNLVGLAEFHDPRCWEIIDVAANLDIGPDPHGRTWDGDTDLALAVHGCELRGTAIAKVTGMELSWLRQLVNDRSPLQTDRLVDRLIEAVVMRRDNRFMVDRLIENGVDVRMLTNFDAWMQASRDYVLQACRAVGDAVFRGGSDADMADRLRDVGALFGLTEADIIEAVAGGAGS